jgi:hypothetical protein
MLQGSRSEQIAKKAMLPKYLKELSALVNYEIFDQNLLDLESTKELRSKSTDLAVSPSRNLNIRFEEKTSPRFQAYIENLVRANSGPVYIWTPRTAFCGGFSVPSMVEVFMGFNFDINTEGILSFQTMNLENNLTLDFSVDDRQQQVLRVETQGLDWFSVEY